MILPAIVYIIIFCYGPMYGIQLAFRKYDFSKGLTGGDWVGFKYFIQYFESPMFWTIASEYLYYFLFYFDMWISGADTAGACSKLVKTAETEKGGADRGLYALFYFNGRYGCHTPDTAFPFYRCGQRSVEKHASDTTFHQPSGYTQCFRTGLCFVRNLAVGRLEQHYLHCGTLLSGRAAV